MNEHDDLTGDKMAYAGPEPDIGVLTAELKRCAVNNAVSTRISNAENVRFCRWTGRTEDGKKHKETQGEAGAFPWDGASDTRVSLVDEIVNSMVDLCVTSFWRATPRVSAVASDDVSRASSANSLMEWLLNTKLYSELTREVELCGQYLWTYGWAGAHVTWQQEIGQKSHKLTLDQVIELANQSQPGTVMSDLPALIQNPEADDQVAEVLMGAFPNLKKRRALKAVKEIRSNGECDFPVPTVVKNQPCVAVLSPYDELSFPPETTDIQSARAVFRRVYMTQAELEQRALTDGWDHEWVEAAIEMRGKRSNFYEFSSGAAIQTNSMYDRENLIEVVYGYQRAFDDDDIPGIWCTVFCPGVEDKWGKYELLDYAHGKYPFVVWRTETIHRKLTESRSVSEIAHTWQNEVKAQRDSIFDYTSLSTIPPLEVPKSRSGSLHISPASRLPVNRRGEIGFMEVPQREPTVAFRLMDKIQVETDKYFGRPTELVSPALTQMRQQRIVNNWLHGWTDVFRQVMSLSLQYLEPEVIQRVAGFPTDVVEDSMEYDITLRFDVRELNSDLVTEKLKAISTMVIPMDVGGRIDRNKLIDKVLRAIDPAMAQEIVMDQGPAAQKMFDETSTEILMMSAGNPPKLRENDPSAGTRLQFAKQILDGNPKYQQQLMNDNIFKDSLEKYAQNLLFSVQQQENAQTGRLGVEASQ